MSGFVIPTSMSGLFIDKSKSGLSMLTSNSGLGIPMSAAGFLTYKSRSVFGISTSISGLLNYTSGLYIYISTLGCSISNSGFLISTLIPGYSTSTQALNKPEDYGSFALFEGWNSASNLGLLIAITSAFAYNFEDLISPVFSPSNKMS